MDRGRQQAVISELWLTIKYISFIVYLVIQSIERRESNRLKKFLMSFF